MIECRFVAPSVAIALAVYGIDVNWVDISFTEATITKTSTGIVVAGNVSIRSVFTHIEIRFKNSVCVPFTLLVLKLYNRIIG